MKFLFDEHIDPAIARSLVRLKPDLSIVLTSVELPGTSDPQLLEYATFNKCILITRDVNTLLGFAYQRIEAGTHTEGVFVLRQNSSVGQVVQDLLLVSEASQWDEWANQITFNPLA
jgi:predicted nuclease of predicted toxin-antitoxin system